VIPLQLDRGTFTIPVLINDKITLDFILDSGAADVTIPSDVVGTLRRTGTLSNADFLGTKTYVLADGSKMSAQTFRIKSLKIGDRVIENVTASTVPAEGSLLLGQSFLNRFKSWSIDNNRQVLVLE
jgi:clan AA aspartic protease (TIGR02281 family)